MSLLTLFADRIWSTTIRFKWTGYKKMEIKVYRMDWTDRGLFGHLIAGDFDCITLERMDTLIPVGRYKVTFYDSPKFKCKVPLIHVPGRSFIEIHWADWERQLEGCIAVSSRRQNIQNMDADKFAEDMNKATFLRLMDALKGADDLWLTIS